MDVFVPFDSAKKVLPHLPSNLSFAFKSIHIYTQIKHFEIARAKKQVRWLHPAAVCRVGEEGEEGEEGSEPELADGPESEEEWAVASEDDTD